ncbi:MAG: hypothetical protein HZA90_11545 [Verrucomicrobia bacterium]|nr:hypothetical protein [Verrucomicrobiota bacterium]
MPFALLQVDLNPPDIERLKRAFRSVDFLTELDAHTLADDGFGILVKNLAPEDAAALCGALRTEGVATEIVDQRALPEMPPTKLVTRLDCQPEALQVYDPLGRVFPLQWGHILMIAAGFVRLSEFTRVRKVRGESYSDADYPSASRVVEETTVEERNFRFILEIVLTRAVQRFSIAADRFNFAYLGARRSADPAENFAELVRDLIQFAPQAALNRGAFCLRERLAEPFCYPSKNAFFEEIIWLLWKMQPPGPEAGDR